MRRCASAASAPKRPWPGGWPTRVMSQPSRVGVGWWGEVCGAAAIPGATGLRRRGELAKEVSSAAFRAAAAPTLPPHNGWGRSWMPVDDPGEAMIPTLEWRRAAASSALLARQQSRRSLVAAQRGLEILVVLAGSVMVLLVGSAGPALAQAADPGLEEVIGRLRSVLVGLLVGLATLFLTVGGLRYLFAGGDPGQVEKAKITLRSAAIGYGLAALAPALVRLLRYVVGA
jgi:hypothetical protein